MPSEIPKQDDDIDLTPDPSFLPTPHNYLTPSATNTTVFRHRRPHSHRTRIPRGQPGNTVPEFHRALAAKRNIGNPSPLGLSGFALTTFVLSAINMGLLGVENPAIVIAPAAVYGGLAQFAAGMWEMAIGNTFGATALTSFGAFWLGIAIILIPGGFDIAGSYADSEEFNHAFAFYLFGWFIFTFLLLLCTLSSSIAFSLVFFFLDWAFLFLALGRRFPSYSPLTSAWLPNQSFTYTGGVFGMLTAFVAWYNALAGVVEHSNSGFELPVGHFRWVFWWDTVSRWVGGAGKGENGRERRRRSEV